MFNLPEHIACGDKSFVFDSQCFHCLRQVRGGEQKAVGAIARMLDSAGLCFILAGNADEPEVGPSVVKKRELVEAFERDRLFELVDYEPKNEPVSSNL